jgi:Spy/CpxP family protein refolding chaperone
MKLMMSLLGLGLALSLVSSSAADEKKEKGKGKKAPAASARFLKKIELSDTQKDQVKAIDKEFAGKFASQREERARILTPEQLKAEKEATEKNKTDGTKGPEARKAVEAALNLSDEQKTKLKAWQKSGTELNTQLLEALKKVLTAEQREELPKLNAPKGKKKAA